MKKDKKHMALNDRVSLSLGLNQGMNFREIGDSIGFSATTISREVQKHIRTVYTDKSGKMLNNCVHRIKCPVSEACDDMMCEKRSCKNCRKVCGNTCPEYRLDVCGRLTGAPYVCTGCDRIRACGMPKRFYDPRLAQEEYEEKLSSSRKGITVTDEELGIADRVFKHGSSRGQSINHIYTYAGGDMPFSKRTAYNYVNAGVFSETIRLDMPSSVTRRKRKSSNGKEKQPRHILRCTDGRTRLDYIIYMDDHPEFDVVQMDCVEGKRGGNGKVLLTLLFVASDAQIGIILENQDQSHVTEAMVKLKEALGRELFQELFPVILTDRGSEFLDPAAIEDGVSTKVFFCDPQRPDQKGSCERNHHEVRKIWHKGTDITFSQDAASHMMDNVNALARPAFHNRTAFDMFLFLHGKENADRLGMAFVPPQDVNLTPSCLTELD